jgi:hypothetical protein
VKQLASRIGRIGACWPGWRKSQADAVIQQPLPLDPVREENKAIVQGTLCFFGTYSVNEAEHTLNLHIESSSFPNWNGTDQQRFLTLTGDELKWTNPTPASGGTAYVIWERAK